MPALVLLLASFALVAAVVMTGQIVRYTILAVKRRRLDLKVYQIEPWHLGEYFPTDNFCLVLFFFVGIIMFSFPAISIWFLILNEYLGVATLSSACVILSSSLMGHFFQRDIEGIKKEIQRIQLKLEGEQ